MYHWKDELITWYKGKSYNYKFRETYVGALFRASSLMPNLQAGFTTIACLPASSALFTSELLAEKVDQVPIDGSTMVEGTDCSTIASSPDDAVHGNFVSRLEKSKIKSNLANRQQKVLVWRTTSYLPVDSSLGGAGTLPRHRSNTLRMPRLGIGTWSRAELPITPPPSHLLIYTTKAIH